MRNDLHPLPVQVVPAADESGRGFLVRLARSNGMALETLLDWLEVPSLVDVAPGGVHALAFVSQTSVRWLGRRLPRKRIVNGVRHRELLGHGWTFRFSLRDDRPQVCTTCLDEGRFCRAEWELGGVISCRRHRQLLIERCGHCGQRLSWLRPAVDLCRCGRYLSLTTAAQAVSETGLAWVHLLLTRLEGATGTRTRAGGLPRWLGELSPDGMTAVVHAFGVMKIAHERIPSYPMGASQIEIIHRGLARLLLLPEMGEPLSMGLADVTYETALETLASRGVVPADRAIAHQLVDWIWQVPQDRRDPRGRPAKGQLNLFGH